MLINGLASAPPPIGTVASNTSTTMTTTRRPIARPAENPLSLFISGVASTRCAGVRRTRGTLDYQASKMTQTLLPIRRAARQDELVASSLGFRACDPPNQCHRAL